MADPGLLSSQELEVLKLLVEGLGKDQVAERLCLSIRTVDFHLGGLRDKANLTGCYAGIHVLLAAFCDITIKPEFLQTQPPWTRLKADVRKKGPPEFPWTKKAAARKRQEMKDQQAAS